MRQMYPSSAFVRGTRLSALASLVTALLTVFAFAAAGYAQPAAAPTGTLEGVVYNVTGGQPLARAKVVVRETAQVVLTDDEGRFSVRGAPVGTVHVDVSYLGFQPISRAVTVAPLQPRRTSSA